jgi:hypothetical protein
MEALFLSSSYKTIHQILIKGICECLEKSNYKVSNEFNPNIKYDCIFVFNRKKLEQHKELLKTTHAPVIYMFCLSDIASEYCVSDAATQTLVFKDKVLNMQNLPVMSLIYQDMLLPTNYFHNKEHSQSTNINESAKKNPLIYLNIDNDYFGDLIFLKLLPVLNTLYNYDIYYQSKQGIGRYLLNQHIKLVRNQQNIEEWLDKSDIVIGSGFVAYEAVKRSKKTIIVGEKGYGGLVAEENLEYHLSTFFQGRNGGKFDEYIPLQRLPKAIETETVDTQKIIEKLSFLQTQNEQKFIQLVEKVKKGCSDNANTSYILNYNYEITKKNSRYWLSKLGFNKLYKPINESECAIILTFREPHTIQGALTLFPTEYEEVIKEYINELIVDKILTPIELS